MKRRAFTMMELIFVIVIIGIIAKFGIEMLIKAYDDYIFSTVQNRLQSQTAFTLQEVTNRLAYRIKPSVIVRDNNNPNFATNYRSLADAKNNGHETILEWIGYDNAGLQGDSNGVINVPNWSGFIDLNNPAHTSSNLISLGTNTSRENQTIQALSNGSSDINDSAIYFIGGDTNINGFGWGGAITNQTKTMHPIKSNPANVDILQSKFATPNDFTNQNVYEFYQLAWSAYALVYSGANGSNGVPYISSLDKNSSTNPPILFDAVLPHGLRSGIQNGQWSKTAANTYTVHLDKKDIKFTYNSSNGTFTCNTTSPTTGAICKGLTR